MKRHGDSPNLPAKPAPGSDIPASQTQQWLTERSDTRRKFALFSANSRPNRRLDPGILWIRKALRAAAVNDD